jgi:tRNA(Ile)-lysidine synthase
MLEEFRFTLDQHCYLDPTRTVVVAVSGGPDSLCLWELLRQLGYRLVIAHLDHGLRSEARTEAKAVQNLARERGEICVVEQEDVAALADRQNLSIEEAARTARYHFLFRQAHLHQAQAVAVGHTADDQVETVLMHLLRGAGLAGLRGMDYYSLPHAWSSEIPLIRPLLGIWRSQILAYIEEHHLQPNLDASNQDRRYYRNRLRHELVPYLENLNPGAGKRIWRMARLLRDDEAALERLVDTAWATCCKDSGAGFVAFDTQCLQAQSLAIQRRLVRRGIARLRPGLRDIDYAAIERALNFLQAPTRSQQIDLAAGLRLELQDNRVGGEPWLWLAAWEADLPGADWPQVDSGSQQTLQAPGEIELPAGWKLSARFVPANPAVFAQAFANANPYQCWLDLERLDFPLLVRSRQPGDRFQPLGMGGHSLKLSDFMINFKLPRRARRGWPLVISGGQIAWVPGYQPSEPNAVRSSTTKVVYLSFKKQP